MSAAAALKKAIFDALRADAGVAALVAANTIETGSPTVPAIYDFVPQAAASEDASPFPYVAIGDDTAVEFDTDEVNGQEHTVTLHIYDRYRGTTRVKQIQDAIYAALHDTQLAVANHNTVYCFWEFSGSVPEPEVLTQHGVSRFRIVTQEAST